LSGVDASVVRKLSEEEMTLLSESILIGRCTAIRSEWSEDGRKIFTYVTIVPQTFLKGDQIPQEITIKQLGGVVGDIVMRVEGSPVFEVDEEVLLFLKSGPNGSYSVIGLSQGKFSIKTDPATGRKILQRKRARKVMLKDGKIRQGAVEEESGEKLFLDEFENRIRNHLQQSN